MSVEMLWLSLKDQRAPCHRCRNFNKCALGKLACGDYRRFVNANILQNADRRPIYKLSEVEREAA